LSIERTRPAAAKIGRFRKRIARTADPWYLSCRTVPHRAVGAIPRLQQEEFMSRRVRRGLAAAACVVAAVLVLGSCSLGFLGDSFTLEGQVYTLDKDDQLVPATYNGTISFLMNGKAVDLATGTVTNGVFSPVVIPVPPSDQMEKWSDVLPPVTPPLSISDGGIEGYVVNTIIVHDSIDFDVMRTNTEVLVVAWYLYTEADVEMSGTGAYNSPLGDPATVVMDVKLKAGWNRVILTRTGTTGSFTDTWTTGAEPHGLSWVHKG
jgi:hypothetical protein